MMKYLIIPGVVYEGETCEQAFAREDAMLEHNRCVDERQREWDRLRKLPMPAMRMWAQERGLVQ